jgi:proton glutamate symport protein
MRKRFPLHWQILLSLVLALVFGYFFPGFTRYSGWMGILFLNALKMVVIPLIISSIITGVIKLGESNRIGRLGLKTIFYYLGTSFLAILTGLILVNLFKPGLGANLADMATIENIPTDRMGFSAILMGIVPSNIFAAIVNGEILPIIFFSVLFGFFISKTKPEHASLLSNFFDAVYNVIMKLTSFIIRFAPLGIFAIVAGEVAKNAGRLGGVATSLGLYMMVVLLGLLIHGLITLPLIVKFIGKSKPYRHLQNMASVLLTAFSTSSSSATLPLTIDSTVKKSGVSEKISGFTLPLGATINMDGTALYECVAALFIAQAYGIDLSFGQQMIVVATALLASIGAAGIPMAGLIMLTIILSAVNLPLEGVGLILAVDRILDMTRTTINVWSDSCGAVVIARTEGEKLLL